MSLEDTNLFIKTQLLPPSHTTQHNRRVGPYAGGVIFMTRDAFQQVGGWEERIKGWGGEDDHMTIKIQKLIQHTYELQNSLAFHLYHRQTNLFGSKILQDENPHYKINLQHIENIRSMTTEALRQECNQLFSQIGKPLPE